MSERILDRTSYTLLTDETTTTYFIRYLQTIQINQILQAQKTNEQLNTDQNKNSFSSITSEVDNNNLTYT